MTSRPVCLLLSGLFLVMAACAGPPIAHEPDVADVTLSAPADQVRAALIQVLINGGYEVHQEDDQNLTTGYRTEIRGPWDGLLRWRFGTERSRVDAVVTAAEDQSSRLRLHVHYEGKDGLFTAWENCPTSLPESVDNQLRLIKNALRIL